MEQTKIALLGIGVMGIGMGGRLLDAGYPLTVYNRTQEKARPLVDRGAKLAITPAEAASGADIIISMLTDDNASREVWLGENGALATAAPKAVLVESSTVTIDWIQELAAAAEKRGIVLVDAPVTGSKPQAASGQILFLAGGPEETIAKITPVLQAMGRGVVYLGPSGSGARMKLINNFVCAAQLAGLAEAVGLIEHSGLDLRKALSVLTQGAPGSPIVKLMAERVTAHEYTPNFTVRLMAKDLDYAIGEGKHHGQKLATASTALKIFEGAIASGRAEEDITSVAEQFRQEKKGWLGKIL